MDSLDEFCGISENGSFEVWNSTTNNFATCFEYLAVVSPPHALLLFISVYYTGSWMPTRVVHINTWVKVRIVISCLIALESLIELISTSVVESYHPPVLILANSLIMVAWTFNGVAMWKIRNRFLIKKCLPTALLISTLLVLVSTTITLYSSINTLLTHMPYHAINNYGIITRSILVLIYLVSLTSCGMFSMAQSNLSLHINEPTIQTQGDGEDERLLRSISQATYYSSIQCVSKDLGVGEDQYNPISKLCFWWVRHLMVKGYKGLIQSEEDLFMLPNSLRTRHVQEVFLKEFYCRIRHPRDKSQMTTSSKTSVSDFDESGSSAGEKIQGGSGNGVYSQRSLVSALHHSFGWQYYSLGILKLLADGLGFAGPLLLHAIVSFMENRKEPIAHGYYYATGLFLSTLLCAFLNAHFSYWVNKVGFKMRAAIITTVYQKALSVSTASLSQFSTGEVVNFMSTDTDRITNFCPSFHQFWSLPFQVSVSLYLLHQQVGLAFLAGLGFAIVVIPINRWLAIKIQALSKDMMRQKDSRVKMMNEILYGIRVIKYYAWERNFERKINEIRSEELKSLKGRKYLDAWCVYFWATTPVIISILTFTTYALMGNKLTAAKVFTSVALFNMLISPLNAFPWVLNGLMEAWVSVQRLQAFLGVEDLDMLDYYSDRNKERQTDIEIVNGQFSWRSEGGDKEGGKEEILQTDIPSTSDSVGCLSSLNVSIKKGQLIGVIGTVGSGKSSLLAAITAEMDKIGGQIYVSCLDSGFGLAAQEPWIQHATVKENILFGQPFDVERYTAVIEACALQEDLMMLPNGDETEVGENGVTLSGGQKARVSLARALYQDKDVYLLDDPLAAVDAQVAAHLFQHCILGLLREKTVILCTHHTKYLKGADHVIVMQHGVITHQGMPSEILTKQDLMSQISREFEGSDDESGLESDLEEKPPQETEEDSGLVADEEKDEGAVKLHVYGSYWLSIGHCLATSILLSLLLMQASRNLSDWWLAYWISHTKTHHDKNVTTMSRDFTFGSHSLVTNYTSTGIRVVKGTVTFYLIVYASFAISNTVFTLFRAFLFAYGGVKAAKVLHQSLLSSILAAPVSFFDATPIGRIINRFSSDMYSIDDSLPFILNIFLAQAYGVAGTVAITCYGLPWLAVLLVPLALIYYYIQNYYRRTSRELKRLMSVTLSPIYAHFSETLMGISTIRALRETQRFQALNIHKLEVNQKANFCAMVASLWLSLRLQFLGVAMVTGVAFIAVLEHHFSTVDPGLVGLAISYALSVTDRLSGMVTSFTETEKQMVSVERAVQYIEDVPSELSGNAMISPHWPSIGQIIFKNVVLVYRRGLPPALSNVSFQVTAGEKVGIVGRTGSGKSSLFLVLFRMVSIQQGVVIVDGVAVATLPLEEFRSRLAVIPQDPFLFSGSVRANMDPWSQYSDADIWTILRRCHMSLAVRNLGGLDANVGERGRNFSVGQRQLICLARALLSRAKILCVDEATASVDMETDELIQQTIRDEFRNSTVLTIAHRIETILDNDRVLVMDKGSVAEFDRPGVLLANRNSLFYALVYGN